jgi:putative phosphoesterase
MRIGLLSDSHGRTNLQAAALAALAGRKVHVLVHCGDVGSPDCLQQLSSLGIPAYVVLGNVDQDAGDLAEIAAECGVFLGRKTVVIPLDAGRSAAATHGNDELLLREQIEGGRHAYVFHGHTHRVRDERRGPVRVINPGALHNSRDPGHPTVAVLDTLTDVLTFLDVPKENT